MAIVAGFGFASRTSTAASGPHIRPGNAVVSPSLELLGTYRTNVYLQEGTDRGGRVDTTPGFALSLNPGVEVAYDADDVRFKIGADYTARKYLGGEIQNLDRFKDFLFKGGLDVLPSSIVGVRVRDDFRVLGFETEADYAHSAYLERFENDATGQVVVRPGTSMEIALGGLAYWADFQTPNDTNPLKTANLNDRFEVGPRLDFKWKFLPKTAVVAGYQHSWTSWGDNWVNTQGSGIGKEDVGDNLGIPDNSAWRVFGGLRGRFTAKTVLNVTAGYAGMDFDEQSVIEDARNELASGDAEPNPAAMGFDDDLDGLAGIMGTVQIEYELEEDHTIDFGFRRDFTDVYFSNFEAFNSPFVEYHGKFGGRARADVGLTFRDEQYFGQVERHDTFTRVNVGGGYEALDFLEIVAHTGWQGRRSETESAEYDDFRFAGGIVLTY